MSAFEPLLGDERDTVRAVAAELGLRWAGGLDRQAKEEMAVPFPWSLPLFAQGGEADLADVLHGRFAGLPALVFTFAPRIYKEDPSAPTRTCVVFRFTARFPLLTLNLHTKMSQALEADKTPFGQRYRVLGRDPDIARLVLTDRVRTYLAQLDLPVRVELGGDALLVHTPAIEPPRWPELVQAGYWLLLQIPDVAWRRFGGSPPHLTIG